MEKYAQSVMLILATVIYLSYLPVSQALGLPDLQVIGTSIHGGEVIDEGVKVLNVSIKNFGKDAFQSFCVAVEVDGEIKGVKEIDGLRGGLTKNASFSLSFAPGDHLVRIFVDFYNQICEENEQNNERVILVHVREIEPDLIVYDVEGVSEYLVDGKPVEMEIDIRNLGHEVDSVFYVEVRAGRSKKSIPITEPIGPGEIMSLSVNITPRGLGSQEFAVKVDSSDNIKESNESNNEWRDNITIYKYLPWYNENFHYRLLVKAEGKGIAQLSIDSRKLLGELGLGDCALDKNSIRLVEYGYEGIKNESVIYCSNFTEDGNVNLKWLSKKGYYMVYFDVVENGNKSKINYTEIIDSANVDVEVLFPPEGWDIDVMGPRNGSRIALNSTYSLIARSNAMIEDVHLEVYRDGAHVDSVSFSSSDLMNFSCLYTFPKEGNYTLYIFSADKAGYTVSKCIEVFVRKADIIVNSLDLPETIYRNVPSVATVDVKSNVLVKNFSIEMKITYEDNTSSIFNMTGSMQKYHEKFNLSFGAKKTGNASVEIKIYLPHDLPEENTDNNLISTTITVLEPPDVKILDAFALSNLSENKPAIVCALVKNPEDESVDVSISLYIARGVLDWSPSKMVCSRKVSLPPRSVVNVSLIWENPKGGKWVFGVGVDIIGVEDGNVMNNRKVGVVEIAEGDETPPVIRDVEIKTDKGEVGYPIEIFANISDESGVKEAKVCLIYPDGHTEFFPMILLNNSWYVKIGGLTTPGHYMFYVEATDSSYLSNVNRSNVLKFEISEDYTPPLFQSIFIIPDEKQLVDEVITVCCIVKDNVAVGEVNITIVKPNGEIVNGKMLERKESIFTYNGSFPIIGKYTFFISAEDINGNRNLSDLHTFWITKNLNDTDSDGIPDWWEKMYGLNPRNPDDATGDMDGDGFTEIKEYMKGLNPTISNTVGGFTQYEMLITMIIGLTLLPMMIVIILSDRRD